MSPLVGKFCAVQVQMGLKPCPLYGIAGVHISGVIMYSVWLLMGVQSGPEPDIG